MTRVIAVASGKGGVGKTTTVANLGAVLANLGRSVTVVDTNLTTPNLSLHLGVPFYPTTLNDVLMGKSHIVEALYIHPSGIRIVPASLSIQDLKKTTARDFSRALYDLLGGMDIILLDTAAGLERNALATLEVADELLIVTQPDIPSVTDALKTKKLAEEMDVDILGIILNRVKRNRKGQLKDEEIMEILEGLKILAKIPEDPAVPLSIFSKNPVVNYKPYSPASQAFRQLGGKLIGQEIVSRPQRTSVFERILGWLRG